MWCNLQPDPQVTVLERPCELLNGCYTGALIQTYNVFTLFHIHIMADKTLWPIHNEKLEYTTGKKN